MEIKRVKHEVVPSAKRLINSLRNMSYDFVRAVADLIDNSIQANASWVSIKMVFDGDHSYVRIADDGHGMSGDELTEAMRFGSERDYGLNELGRFGLGMKTASFSQCRKLTVASRNDPERRNIQIRQWNLDQIDETDSWEVDEIPFEGYSDVVTGSLLDHVGTVVMWEHLDRLMNFKPPDGKKAQAWFNRTAGELDEHLGMVFHRYLSGEVNIRRKLRITVNDTDISSWDPFAKSELATTKLPEKEITVISNHHLLRVRYSPYILPTQINFSSQEAFKRSAGPSKWNSQQGFYIYRENRMIQGGGWCRLRAADEHSKYARVALDVGSESDSALMLDVTKSTVQLPLELRDRLKPLVADLVSESGSRYRSSKREVPQTTKIMSHQQPVSAAAVNNLDNDHTEQSNHSTQTNQTVETINVDSEVNDHISKERKLDGSSLGLALEGAALKAGESLALSKIKTKLLSEDPDSARALGWL